MARFIQDTDYPTIIRNEIKAILLEGYTDAKLLLSESMAIAQIRNYLKGRYDVDAIFEGHDPLPDPDPRDAYMVMITIDCALYHIYSSTAPNLIPEHRSQRYEDALNWLKSVAKGETIADLPLLTDEEGTELTNVRIKSKYKPEIHKW